MGNCTTCGVHDYNHRFVKEGFITVYCKSLNKDVCIPPFLNLPFVIDPHSEIQSCAWYVWSDRKLEHLFDEDLRKPEPIVKTSEPLPDNERMFLEDLTKLTLEHGVELNGEMMMFPSSKKGKYVVDYREEVVWEEE